MRNRQNYTIDEILRAAPHGPAVGGHIMAERAANATALLQAQIEAARLTKSQTRAMWAAALMAALLALVTVVTWLWPHPFG